MTYEEFFAEVKEQFQKADVSNVTEHLAYQFNITGEAEGVFYVEVKDGRLYVEPYDYHDRDAVFTAKAETLKKIAAGEGNIDKALKLKDLIESAKKKEKKDKKKK